MSAVGGLYEFVFSAQVAERERLLAFWSQLGFEPETEGSLTSGEADALYGHASKLQSVRLRHSGSRAYETGLVRLQFWEALSGEGLGARKPLITGSRWMGMYTADILEVRDSLEGYNCEASERWLSELVSAPLANPAPEVTWANPLSDCARPFTSTRTGASPLSSAAVSTAPGLARLIAACRIKIVREATPTSCNQAMPSTRIFTRGCLALNRHPMARPMILVMNRPHSARCGWRPANSSGWSGCAPPIARQACYRSTHLILMQMIVAH